MSWRDKHEMDDELILNMDVKSIQERQDKLLMTDGSAKFATIIDPSGKTPPRIIEPPSTKITLEEWIQALGTVVVHTVDGYTSEEIAKQLGLSHDYMRTQIGKYIKKGMLKFNGYRQEVRIDGHKCQKPVYVPIRTGA